MKYHPDFDAVAQVRQMAVGTHVVRTGRHIVGRVAQPVAQSLDQSGRCSLEEAHNHVASHAAQTVDHKDSAHRDMAAAQAVPLAPAFPVLAPAVVAWAAAGLLEVLVSAQAFVTAAVAVVVSVVPAVVAAEPEDLVAVAALAVGPIELAVAANLAASRYADSAASDPDQQVYLAPHQTVVRVALQSHRMAPGLAAVDNQEVWGAGTAETDRYPVHLTNRPYWLQLCLQPEGFRS